MDSIVTTSNQKTGDEFQIIIHREQKRLKKISLNRMEAIQVAQNLLSLLKETKTTYNKNITGQNLTP